MRPFYLIFAVVIGRAYSLESYNYPAPSQPLEAGSSPHQSFGHVNQGYNYQPPTSASEGIRSSISGPSRNFDNSAFGSFPVGSSTFGGSQGYQYEPARLNDLSSFGSSSRSHHNVAPIINVNNGFPSSNNYDDPSNAISHGLSPEEVRKHVYIYVAPPDPAVAETKQVLIPSPVVNHKIIFIKAPAQSQTRTQVVPLPSKQEEKTLVYVLVKKPEEQQIDVQPLPAREASKPEVYFIKYNTKKGAEHQGFPSGNHPIVEDAFRGSKDPSTSQSQSRPSPIYGPSH